MGKTENYKSVYVYTQEDYYKNPKEIFGFLLNLIKKSRTSKTQDSLLDIGCSRGEFLYYVKSQGVLNRFAGVDYSQTLIKLAKEFSGLKGVSFYCHKAHNFQLKEKFDFINMMGTLSFYDDVSAPLKNLKKHLLPGGRIFMTGLFNPFDVDVIVRYRNRVHDQGYEKGFNQVSLRTLKEKLKESSLEIKKIHRFKFSKTLNRRQDPMRSWTVKLDGEKKFMIGLGVVYDLLTVEIGSWNEKN